MNEKYTVDINELLAAKGISLSGISREFLARLLHLDFCNKFFEKGYEGGDFCTNGIKYLDITLVIEGLDNIQDDGSMYTFASNHPLGGIDGVALGSIVYENFKSGPTLLANDFLMAVKGLATICVPINMTGAQSRDLPDKIDAAFRSDRHVVIFPAGLCSRWIDGRVQDLTWGKAFLKKSIETNRKIVPVHFYGRNSNLFYSVALLCRLLRLKKNLAMALLPHEMFRSQHKSFKIVFGTPIDPQSFDDSHTMAEWSQIVRGKAYEL